MIAGKQFAPCFCFACLPVYKQDGCRERPRKFLYCVCMTLLCFGSDNSFIEYIVYNLGCLHTKYSRCNILAVMPYMTLCVLMSYSFGDYEFLEGLCTQSLYNISICWKYLWYISYFHQLMNTGMLNMIHHLNNRPTYIYI